MTTSIEKAIGEYLSDCKRRGFSEYTLTCYTNELKKFFGWLAGRYAGIKEIGEVPREAVEEYQMHLYKRKGRLGGRLSVSTQYYWIGIICWFFRWLVGREIILTNPAASVHLPRRAVRLPGNYLSLREMQKLLSASDLCSYIGVRNRAALEVFYTAGIRAAELGAIRIKDVYLERGTLKVFGKGEKERIVPLGQAAVYYVREYLEKSRPHLVKKKDHDVLFVTGRGDPISYDAINMLVSRTAKAAGIKRRITPHCIRHTCATLMLRGKADIRHIQELLGHSCLSSTQIYTKVEISDLKKVHAKCHPREKEPIEK